MSRELEVVARYRAQLERLPDPARRRRLPLAAAAVTIAAVALALAATLRPGGAEPALAVERDGDALVVRLRDATAGPVALARALRREGVHGFVGVAPAAPDAVGRWVAVRATDAAGRDAPRAAARIRVDGAVVRIPRDLGARPVLIAGVAPRPGQRPVYDRDGRIRRR
ncbi:MAG TPA: hypothetical protein VF533_23900 [Solirubrobacteraceae bacterium]